MADPVHENKQAPPPVTPQVSPPPPATQVNPLETRLHELEKWASSLGFIPKK